MSSRNTLASERQWTTRKRQEAGLQVSEAALKKLASEGRKTEFFAQILPLLDPLKSYIRRRLRVAYLSMQIRSPLYTSGDILDETILKAYKDYAHKPRDLTLEQWLYQIANGILEKHLRERHVIGKHRKSLEGLTQAELRTLEEGPITADVEGEIYLPEDLDDSEIRPREFNAPTDSSNPEEELEKKEELEQLFRVLGHIPVNEQIIFELFAVEGFPKEAVARIANVSPDEVPRIVQKVRAEILHQLRLDRKSADVAQVKRTA